LGGIKHPALSVDPCAIGKMKNPIILLLFCFILKSSNAVILFGSGDPTYNTTSPVFADGTDGGWKYVGEWGQFTGTPIASNYFITAHHVGGDIGQSLIYRGIAYPTIAVYDDTVGQTDLRIWQVGTPFPDWAPLYSLGTESNQTFVVIGRGTQRGVASYVTTIQPGSYPISYFRALSKKELQALYPDAVIHGQTITFLEPIIVQRGWEFGVSDHIQRWGINTWTFTGFYDVAAFDDNGDPNECYLSGGDSGGACFVQVNGAWQLCAINYGIDNDGAYYRYAYGGDGSPFPKSQFYCTRTFERLDWIYSVIGQ
jgi:hypothetical protein